MGNKMTNTKIKLGQVSDDNLWIDGNDLHWIDESGQHGRIKNYTTDWYMSNYKINLVDYKEECNESITMVGNNKKWKNKTVEATTVEATGELYDKIEESQELKDLQNNPITLSEVLDGYPLVYRGF